MIAPWLGHAADHAPFRGRLTRNAQGEPTLTPVSGTPISLTGDAPTMGVLRDERLAGTEFEVVGERAASGPVRIRPIHTRSLFAYRDGRRLMVTYWCDICTIRTYTPGKCACCQEETQLDLRPPDQA